MIALRVWLRWLFSGPSGFALVVVALAVTGCTSTSVETEHWKMKRCSFLQRLEVPALDVTTNGTVTIRGYATDGGADAAAAVTAAAVGAVMKAAK
jgi:hypothetical protein